MNGLRYIRTRCNLSLSELAEFIGVTRQALSSWESGKKEIPEQRLEQLADFFGIDKVYLGEISEDEKRCLIEKAMFRYNDNGKETYRYKRRDGRTDPGHVPMCFMEDRGMNLDEEYVLARRKKQETLRKIDDLIKWTDNTDSIESQTMCINRGCRVYGMINALMEEMRGMKSYIRMPFYYELVDVWKAMLMAYGLMEKDERSFLDRSDYYCGEDGEWIIQLCDYIKAHWDTELAFHEKHHEDMINEMKRERSLKQEEGKEVKHVKDQILEAEKNNRQFQEEHPDHSQISVVTFFK